MKVLHYIIVAVQYERHTNDCSNRSMNITRMRPLKLFNEFYTNATLESVQRISHERHSWNCSTTRLLKLFNGCHMNALLETVQWMLHERHSWNCSTNVTWTRLLKPFNECHMNALLETIGRRTKCLLRVTHIGRKVTISHMQWVDGQRPAAQLRAHHESRLAFFHGPTFVVLHTFRVAARGPQRHSIAGQWPRGQFTWHHLADKENNYNDKSKDVSI